MVRTTTRRPCSAAHTPSAAAVVVLPTPPAPQQTTMRVWSSVSRAARSSAGALVAIRPSPARRPRRPARRCRPASVPSASSGSRTMRLPRSTRTASCSRSSATRSACSRPSASSPATRASVAFTPAAVRSARTEDLRAAEVRPPTARSALAGSRGGRTWLTTTAPTGSEASRRSASASMVSCTGISSSRVTTWTAVVWLRSIRVIDSAWPWMGPIRAMSATSALTLRNRTTRPVGGASRMTTS